MIQNFPETTKPDVMIEILPSLNMEGSPVPWLAALPRTKVNYFPVWLRKRLISAGLEPVLSHTLAPRDWKNKLGYYLFFHLSASGKCKFSSLLL